MSDLWLFRKLKLTDNTHFSNVSVIVMKDIYLFLKQINDFFIQYIKKIYIYVYLKKIQKYKK